MTRCWQHEDACALDLVDSGPVDGRVAKQSELPESRELRERRFSWSALLPSAQVLLLLLIRWESDFMSLNVLLNIWEISFGKV